MLASITHFLSDHFPDLGHPVYQSVLETLTFVVVTTMLIGSLIGAVILIVSAEF
jgi:hypothetical protein